MVPTICQEATNFLRACDAILALVTREMLSVDDRELILINGSALLTRLTD